MIILRIAFLLLSIFGCSVSSFSQSLKSILPTPDSTFFTNPKPNAENIIEKYVISYFNVTQPTEVLERVSNVEGTWDCHTRTVYGNISIDTYTCDMQLEQTIRFKNYTYEEVNRIARFLLKDDEFNKWIDNRFEPIDATAGCFLEIKDGDNTTIIEYGCSD